MFEKLRYKYNLIILYHNLEKGQNLLFDKLLFPSFSNNKEILKYKEYTKIYKEEQEKLIELAFKNIKIINTAIVLEKQKILQIFYKKNCQNKPNRPYNLKNCNNLIVFDNFIYKFSTDYEYKDWKLLNDYNHIFNSKEISTVRNVISKVIKLRKLYKEELCRNNSINIKDYLDKTIKELFNCKTDINNTEINSYTNKIENLIKKIITCKEEKTIKEYIKNLLKTYFQMIKYHYYISKGNTEYESVNIYLEQCYRNLILFEKLYIEDILNAFYNHLLKEDYVDFTLNLFEYIKGYKIKLHKYFENLSEITKENIYYYIGDYSHEKLTIEDKKLIIKTINPLFIYTNLILVNISGKEDINV